MAKDEFENMGDNEEREPNADLKVHHYHAHDKECNDMGHCLHKNDHEKEEYEHSEKHGEATMPDEMNEHTEPGNIKDREELNPSVHKGEYPGIIRRLR